MLLCRMLTLEDSGFVPCRQECWSTSPLSLWQGIQKRFSRLRREVLPDLAAVSAALSFLMLSFASWHCSMDIREKERPTELCGRVLFISRRGVRFYWKYEPKDDDYFFTFENKNSAKLFFLHRLLSLICSDEVDVVGRRYTHVLCRPMLSGRLPCSADSVQHSWCPGACWGTALPESVLPPPFCVHALRLLVFYLECIACCFGFKQHGVHSFCIFVCVCVCVQDFKKGVCELVLKQ